MGRPYADEMAKLRETYEWSRCTPIDVFIDAVRGWFDRPLLVVGSGGSYSGAYFVARLHETCARLPAKALTPLEFVLHPSPEQSAILFLSAGGSNPDVLQAARRAILSDAPVVAALCARLGSKLADVLRCARHANVVEFESPAGKDGFLATNSLLASCTLAVRAYAAVGGVEPPPETLPAFDHAADDLSLISESLSRPNQSVLAAGWGWPIGVDLESKFSESGLAAVSVTDFRNFAHGRHNGLARNLAATNIVALETPEDAALSARTLSALPRDLPRVVLSSPLSGPSGTLDLLVQAFRYVGLMGRQAGVDPGRPKVPAFGRKLYHAGIGKIAPVQDPEAMWIRRKVTHAVWESASEDIRLRWRKAFRDWTEILSSADIGGIVLDYDGTLCEPDERFGNPAAELGTELRRLASEGILIGIATGRGKSVLPPIRRFLPAEVWPAVTVGLYNGGLLITLDEEPSVPSGISDPALQNACEVLQSASALSGIVDLEVRPTQIKVTGLRPFAPGLLRRMVIERLRYAAPRDEYNVYQSGHSVDVVPATVSKNSVADRVRLQCRAPSDIVMTLGDQGALGGNDFQFLATPYSLSVDQASSDLGGCWHLAPAGERRSQALLRYLRALRPTKGGRHRFHLSDFGIRPR